MNTSKYSKKSPNKTLGGGKVHGVVVELVKKKGGEKKKKSRQKRTPNAMAMLINETYEIVIRS